MIGSLMVTDWEVTNSLEKLLRVVEQDTDNGCALPWNLILCTSEVIPFYL